MDKWGRILRPEGERKLAGGVSHRISGKAEPAPEGRGIGVDITLLSPLPGQESLPIVSVVQATGYPPLPPRVINDVRASIGRSTFNHTRPHPARRAIEAHAAAMIRFAPTAP